MEIRDGSGPAAPLLGTICGYTRASPLFSSSNEVYVEILVRAITLILNTLLIQFNLRPRREPIGYVRLVVYDYRPRSWLRRQHHPLQRHVYKPSVPVRLQPYRHVSVVGALAGSSHTDVRLH